MSTNTHRVVRNMDWDLLRTQKTYCENEAANAAEIGHIYDGIVSIIDAIQDAAVADGLASEVEVFGSEEEA